MTETSSRSTSADRWPGSITLAVAATLAAATILAACGGSQRSASSVSDAGAAASRRSASSVSHTSAAVAARAARHRASAATQAPPRQRVSATVIGRRVMTFVDHSRLIRLPGRPPQPRRLVTVIRYPEHLAGPFPLVVFGHGFAVTPAIYSRLLNAWAHAGYVVAAPVFPLENANAPGGPDEADIVNQPRDMSFVITRLLAVSADRRGPLAGMIDPRRIAVSGQSDGGETALAAAYYSNYRDRRVRAAIILSGARLPGTGPFYFPPSSPPLLAVQGTADTINPPQFTYDFFRFARRPKYLLRLLGAGHLPPYTYEQPQLSIVERVTIAFLDRYLKSGPRAIHRMIQAGNVPGTSLLEADR